MKLNFWTVDHHAKAIYREHGVSGRKELAMSFENENSALRLD